LARQFDNAARQDERCIPFWIFLWQFDNADGVCRNADARIHFRGRPNRPAIKKFIALLELSADTFPA
jgi:hypothetical protein